jgi:YVTN family beta-propeller protein
MFKRRIARVRSRLVGTPAVAGAAVAGLGVVLLLLAAAGPFSGGSSRVSRAASPRVAPVVQAPALPGAQPISSRDRVYTADQVSNTVTVINPKTNEVLGTIPLGHDRLDQILGPIDRSQINVHGLGFSRDGSKLDVISVTSNAAQIVRTRDNRVRTAYVGRSPHEGFVSPDGRTLWVAVRGQDYVSVLDSRTARQVQRIRTADGPSKVVFSPDGRLAYVNHLRASEVDVIRVRDRRIVNRIRGVAPRSSDEALSPDGRELWLGHPFDGKVTVVDARRMRALTILATGPRTNHPNFVTKRDGRNYVYVTVAGLNQVLVFRRDGAHPTLVRRIQTSGAAPHGIWPSPDNTRMYVALQKSDAVDVIDTATDIVIKTLHIGQDPMALVYVANAVPHGNGRRGLTQQGLGKRIQTMAAQVRGSAGSATVTVRTTDGIDELDFGARGLPPSKTFTAYGVRPDGTSSPLTAITAGADGNVDQALAFTDFFGVYTHVYLAPGAAAAAATNADLCTVTGR